MKKLLMLLALAALPVFAADVTGTWKSEFDSQIGVQKYTYTLKQDGETLTGKASSEIGDQKRETELKEGKVVGDDISFVELLNFQDNEIRITYTGKLTGNADEIKFSRAVGDFATEDILAKRESPAAGAAPTIIRIKAGSDAPFTDSSGNVWQAEQGFSGGDVIARPDLAVENTKDAGLFQSEHYAMESFSTKVPNGKYEAKLYFAETFDGITGPGGRVFSFNVQGKEFKDFDVFAKAGGANRAYIETVPVEVTDGTFKIIFTSNVENPQINAVEIIPQGAGSVASAPSAEIIRIKAGSDAPFTDSSGNVWQAEQGFSGGDVIARPDLAIENTKDAGLFQSEHYAMESFSTKVPNGKYEAKLYFAETFDGITGPGGRVFSFNVQGKEFKDFDVYAKTGGANRAYIETVPVEVTDGTFKIIFTPNIENPQINAVEIIPQSGAGSSAAAVSAGLTGEWEAEFDTQRGLQKYTFTLKQEGPAVTGKVSVETADQKREAELKDGKVEGDTVTFAEPMKIRDNEIDIIFTGKVSAGGDEIRFTRKVGDFGTTEAPAKRKAESQPAAPAAPADPAGQSPTSVLDPARKLKNPPVLSAGSGKEPGDFKSGIHTITSAGLERKFTLDIPADYDNRKPYRLIFAMHMMGGHMDTMVNNKFYGLKTYAEKDDVPCIFVAPEGYTDQSPWRGRDDKDHIFFADMLALCKDRLSIDTSRVFCCGFSFGAMVTYSLSLEFQKDLRAVACYAPANWNIYLPTNKREPIAFFSTTGTEDGLCKYVNSDDLKQGGKYCFLTHLENNGVKALPEIPLATTPTHVTTEFKGCPEEYPVLFGSFLGGHTDTVKDPGSDVNWIAKETWDFFMRF